MDMTRIHGELSRLREAQKNSSSLKFADMFAEEIICRSIGGDYIWNEDRLTATIQLHSGFSITAIGDESQQVVEIIIEWFQTGREFENVRKYIHTAAENCCARLRKARWAILGRQINVSQCRIQAQVSVSELQKVVFLEQAALGLKEATEFLRFK